MCKSQMRAHAYRAHIHMHIELTYMHSELTYCGHAYGTPNYRTAVSQGLHCLPLRCVFFKYNLSSVDFDLFGIVLHILLSLVESHLMDTYSFPLKLLSLKTMKYVLYLSNLIIVQQRAEYIQSARPGQVQLLQPSNRLTVAHNHPQASYS